MRQQPNLGRTDRVVRLVGGALLIVAGPLLLGGVRGIVVALAGALLVLSGWLGFCHILKVCGISSLRKD